jgi:hypothetical protein
MTEPQCLAGASRAKIHGIGTPVFAIPGSISVHSGRDQKMLRQSLYMGKLCMSVHP